MDRTCPPSPNVLSWLHIGGLHITEAGEQNHRDLQRIVALANSLPPASIDFALLPAHGTTRDAMTRTRWSPCVPARASRPAHLGWTTPGRTVDGSDRDRVDAGPAKGILNTQLGLNRNGRRW